MNDIFISNIDMCGILAILGEPLPKVFVQQLSKRMSHRGPDENDMKVLKQGILCHERLSIIDLHTGKQPIKGEQSTYVIHNGEIYNHMNLRKTILKKYQFTTTSDSEVIVHLYEELGYDFLHLLDGVYAFVVVNGTDFIAARDPIGVKPLYYGEDRYGRMYFSSEMKVIVDQCPSFAAFPPGYYYTPKTGFVRFFKPNWFDEDVANKSLDLKELKKELIKATKKRLMTDVPLGALLSGGLDSSLTSAIAARLLKEEGQQLHTFSIGLNKEAPDLIAARKVADFIEAIHHEFYFSIAEGIAIIEKLIWHLETYDVTSIRASTPMYFMSEKIKELGVKVVLSGEGADEIFGGYLYFRNAPSTAAFQKETIDRVRKLSTADCLRADKSTMAHGLEVRVPFLDQDFLQLAMTIDGKYKQPNTYGNVEKFILRKAFDNPQDPYLPEEVLWRQKEQFSDGVGYSWIDSLIAHCDSQVSDEEMKAAETFYPINTPTTKEAFYYRKIFHKHFPQNEAAMTVKKWIPKWQENTDPSGRANAAHDKANVDISQKKAS